MGNRGEGEWKYAPMDSVSQDICLVHWRQRVSLVLEAYPDVSVVYQSGFICLEPWDQLSVKIIITK